MHTCKHLELQFHMLWFLWAYVQKMTHAEYFDYLWTSPSCFESTLALFKWPFWMVVAFINTESETQAMFSCNWDRQIKTVLYQFQDLPQNKQLFDFSWKCKMFRSPLSWHWQNFWTFARETKNNWMYEEGYSKKKNQNNPAKQTPVVGFYEPDSLLFMLPVLSFLSKRRVCLRFVLKILFLPSLFQFFGFASLLCFLLCSCTLFLFFH